MELITAAYSADSRITDTSTCLSLHSACRLHPIRRVYLEEKLSLKILSGFILDFHRTTYFSELCHIPGKKKAGPFVLRSGWRGTKSVLVTAVSLHAFPSPF